MNVRSVIVGVLILLLCSCCHVTKSDSSDESSSVPHSVVLYIDNKVLRVCPLNSNDIIHIVDVALLI